MANEQTTVPLFVAAEVLTAVDMNLSAGTGVPVFSNSTTRDAAFGGAGEKVLAEGQLCYLSDSNIVQYYSGAAWATVGPAAPGALTLIKTQTIGTAVSSVAVTSAFSSTYDNYKIMVNGGVGSATVEIGLQLGATTTGYYYSLVYGGFTGGAAANAAATNASSFLYAAHGNTTMTHGNIELISPNLAKPTNLNGFYVVQSTTGLSGTTNGYLNNSTQYTDFTLVSNGGTITGGTIYVYGYAKA